MINHLHISGIQHNWILIKFYIFIYLKNKTSSTNKKTFFYRDKKEKDRQRRKELRQRWDQEEKRKQEKMLVCYSLRYFGEHKTSI